MFKLIVFNPAHADRPLVIRVELASEVLELVPRLLLDHADCERIEVHDARGKLFSVDCASNRPA
ncbi:MAG: hypothetical protein JWO33_2094 [Caulobacteraceae bacterium]|nr:hypothetical protein [Caulobacteraceae bacterium]